ncbi:hypothetical protein [Kineococcus rhizosphaerae]|uniref:Uncharacterized protein n=1 Tax=Kineococcus rhizosphaerae TaxID=559628 RepID=A0A2T0QWS2_9ACTN|nr:hypothetical protein [Kineococcus rhizosphaerae]PRY09918.1 hypothetical protein CLV37_11926 [Kineococcus rhizosphaerae]
MKTAADQPTPSNGEPPLPVWHAAPANVLPGIAPIALVLGRSASTVVTLSVVRAFASGLSLTLTTHVRGPVQRGDLFAEISDGPYEHAQDEEWEAGRFRWGLELADGRRVSNLDAPTWDERAADPDWLPPAPVLTAGGGSGSESWVEQEYWLWPLPPAGRLRLTCQWLDQGIDASAHDLDAEPFLQAAARAQPLWPAA